MSGDRRSNSRLPRVDAALGKKRKEKDEVALNMIHHIALRGKREKKDRYLIFQTARKWTAVTMMGGRRYLAGQIAGTGT